MYLHPSDEAIPASVWISSYLLSFPFLDGRKCEEIKERSTEGGKVQQEASRLASVWCLTAPPLVTSRLLESTAVGPWAQGAAGSKVLSSHMCRWLLFSGNVVGVSLGMLAVIWGGTRDSRFPQLKAVLRVPKSTTSDNIPIIFFKPWAEASCPSGISLIISFICNTLNIYVIN